MITPSFALDFTTATLDARVTFTRSGNTATVTNSSGNVVGINENLPRFDYNPITLVCKGLLVEEARTNLLLQSQDFSTTWANVNTTESVNVIVSPDGTQNADKIEETSATGNHTVQQSLTIDLTSVNHTFSCYVKAGERTRGRISFFRTSGSFPQIRAEFNLVAKTISGSGVNGATYVANSAFINDVGNGWFRIGLSGFTGQSGNHVFDIYTANDLGSVSYAGTTGYGFYLWGAQLEAGAFTTSYIPTTTTALTRNADVATITGTNFSDFWQAVKGGASVLATPSTVSGIRPLVQFDDNTANEIIALRGNTTNPELYIVDGNTPQAQIYAGTIAAVTAYSLTGWWQENNSFAQLNTQASVRDNTVTIPTVTQARVGSDGTNYLNGIIAAIYYYDELANSIYDSLRLLGYTGTVTDMLLQYYLARGATSNSLTDAEIEFLGVKGFTTGTIDDRWTNYLISLGYSGTITDMKYQYWKSPE